MNAKMQYGLISAFPDFRQQNFHLESYNRQFKEMNILIHAEANHIYYPEHWGPLSIKTAFNGSEFYKINNCEFSVNDKNYFIVNNGNNYSSYINSASRVRSFTINFSSSFVDDVLTGCSSTGEYLLDNFGHEEGHCLEFYEKLNQHDHLVSPVIFSLLELVPRFHQNVLKIEELYFQLLGKIIAKQQELEKQMFRVPVAKISTKRELYKRLSMAKDFIDSCYTRDISIAELASVCFLNQTYFLRQFKNFFKITPRQYLINRRMQVARSLLDSEKDISITEVCFCVGYHDLASFSKMFKKFYFCSPMSYQRLDHGTTIK